MSVILTSYADAVVAALQITNLYKTGLSGTRGAFNAGYVQALKDTLETLHSLRTRADGASVPASAAVAALETYLRRRLDTLHHEDDEAGEHDGNADAQSATTVTPSRNARGHVHAKGVDHARTARSTAHATERGISRHPEAPSRSPDDARRAAGTQHATAHTVIARGGTVPDADKATTTSKNGTQPSHTHVRRAAPSSPASDDSDSLLGPDDVQPDGAPPAGTHASERPRKRRRPHAPYA